ncbi:MAG: serine/threonine protein kinase, partial [Gemmatimonadetes bacterium]|nr:serine/threonine protein kinase [Gemmatimonadota bacterium]
EIVAAPGARLEVGATFDGRYEIRQLLGAGGMGTVYRAVDRELGETVALKTLSGASLAEGRGPALDRFREEIRLARRISHRNVVRTHDLGVVDGTYYLTMELVDGRSLEDVLAQEGTLSPRAVHSIAVQALRALDAAHAVGVVHRDIKPPNLLLDGSGLLKVTDFGIARLADAGGRAGKLTATGMVVGTPAYMAPEQLAGEAVDARADLYALGAVLYECLTGKSPHEGLGLMQLFARAQQGTPAPDVRAERPDTPAGLAEVVRQALSPRAAGRYANAQAMLDALEATA